MNMTNLALDFTAEGRRIGVNLDGGTDLAAANTELQRVDPNLAISDLDRERHIIKGQAWRLHAFAGEPNPPVHHLTHLTQIERSTWQQTIEVFRLNKMHLFFFYWLTPQITGGLKRSTPADFLRTASCQALLSQAAIFTRCYMFSFQKTPIEVGNAMYPTS